MHPVRICSLVPAATEALFSLGLGDQVVAVTHECDWPPEAAALPVVTLSALGSERRASAEIDRLVAESSRKGEPLYLVDEEAFSALDPDVAVAQAVCDVCAVSATDVRRLDVEVVDYSPTTLDGIASSLAALGARLGARDTGHDRGEALRRRVAGVAQAVAGRPRPRVVVAEWLDPPFLAGHWVPEMVAAAGGLDVGATPGAPSERTTWEAIAALEPDVLVLAPCGYDLERTLEEAPAALPAQRVVAVDANAYFSRPGPRVADGVKLLAYVLHSEVRPDPGLAFATLR